jgi:hypothetical protein
VSLGNANGAGNSTVRVGRVQTRLGHPPSGSRKDLVRDGECVGVGVEAAAGEVRLNHDHGHPQDLLVDVVIVTVTGVRQGGEVESSTDRFWGGDVIWGAEDMEVSSSLDFAAAAATQELYCS